jgi:hypothetical protein
LEQVRDIAEASSPELGALSKAVIDEAQSWPCCRPIRVAAAAPKMCADGPFRPFSRAGKSTSFH